MPLQPLTWVALMLRLRQGQRNRQEECSHLSFAPVPPLNSSHVESLLERDQVSVMAEHSQSAPGIQQPLAALFYQRLPLPASRGWRAPLGS